MSRPSSSVGNSGHKETIPVCDVSQIQRGFANATTANGGSGQAHHGGTTREGMMDR